MKLLVLITAILLIVLSISLFFKSDTFLFKKNFYIILGIIIILGFIVYPANITKRYLTDFNTSNSNDIKNDIPSDDNYIYSFDENDTTLQEAINKKELVLDNNEDYLKFLEVMQLNPSQFKGFEIMIRGMVDGSVSNRKQEFNIVRSYNLEEHEGHEDHADHEDSYNQQEYYGVLCQFKNAENAINGSWYNVYGKIDVKVVDGALVPVVNVDKIIKTVPIKN